MLVGRRQSHRTRGTFRSSRTSITAGSSRTNITAGTVLTAGTEGSTYQAPKCLNDTTKNVPASKKHDYPGLSVDQELDRVLERMDSATTPSLLSSRKQKSCRGRKQKKEARQRNAPTRMFGFLRRRDGSKNAVPAKAKALSKSTVKELKGGQGIMAAASARLQKNQYGTSAQTATLSFDAAQVFRNKRNDHNTTKAKSTAELEPKPKDTSSTNEDLVGSILMVPSNDSAANLSIQQSVTSSTSTAAENASKSKRSQKKKQRSCPSLFESWNSSNQGPYTPPKALKEPATSTSSSIESMLDQLKQASISDSPESSSTGAYAIPPPPCLQVTTSMSSVSSSNKVEWKTTVSTTSNRNGTTYTSPSKQWTTMVSTTMDRNGTPKPSKEKFSVSDNQWNQTGLIIEDSDSISTEEDEALPPSFQYTTSMSSVTTAQIIEWTTVIDATGRNGTPFGAPQRSKKLSCTMDEAVPPPPLVGVSSLSLKQPQRKLSLTSTTRAESPPTLQFTASLESVSSRWSYKNPHSVPRYEMPPPPVIAAGHNSHQPSASNEITLLGTSTPTIPTSMIEIEPGKFEKVRCTEETILYVAAQATGSTEPSRIVSSGCISCSTTNFHVCDAAYVLCPGCRTVQATDRTPGWGIAIGFSRADYDEWCASLLGGN